MQSFLQAYARAWNEAGAGTLGRMVSNLKSCGFAAPAGDNVPVGILADYEQAIENSTSFVDLQRELKRNGRRLAWMQGDMKMPAGFRNRFAYVEVAGPQGMIAQAGFRCGLYLQQRQVEYPSHWHAAVEDYLIVSGTALWQTDDDDFEPRPPGSHLKHSANQPHATTTLQEPLLALWFWQGNISVDTYRIVGVDA